MTDEVIQDLKQFIAATVSQEGFSIKSELKSDFRADLKADLNALEHRLTTQIADLSQSVADAMDATNLAVDDQLKDHEKRMGKLERKAI